MSAALSAASLASSAMPDTDVVPLAPRLSPNLPPGALPRTEASEPQSAAAEPSAQTVPDLPAPRRAAVLATASAGTSPALSAALRCTTSPAASPAASA